MDRESCSKIRVLCASRVFPVARVICETLPVGQTRRSEVLWTLDRRSCLGQAPRIFRVSTDGTVAGPTDRHCSTASWTCSIYEAANCVQVGGTLDLCVCIHIGVIMWSL